MFQPSTRKWRNWQTHQLEGLAVAIPWGFESPLPHHSTLLSARLRRAERLAHGKPCPEQAVRRPQAGEVQAEGRAIPHVECCESKDDDGILVEWRTTSICFVVQTTAFTSAKLQTS